VDIHGNHSAAADIASLIDHTLLKPEATESDVAQLCREAREHHFAAVCVNPCWVRFAVAELSGASAKVATVVGFPLGANRMAVKIAETIQALEDGASELDMVLNLGALRSGQDQFVLQEIDLLARLAHNGDALLKVILETCLLNDEQKRLACKIAAAAGADFVKTSTGFSKSGATAADVRLMREIVGDRIGVKASGGIRTLAALREMVSAGANRIGSSSGVQILAELKNA